MSSHLYFNLLKYFFELYKFERLSVPELKDIQLQRFKKLFNHARENSSFYRNFYKKTGVYDLTIKSFDDIKKIPVIDKSILRTQKPEDLLTVPINTPNINVHSTSGSTGVPFKVYYNRIEDYSAHCRVLYALLKMGYNPFKRITMVTRYEPDDTFEIEKEVKLLSQVQKIIGVFNRTIISIYESPDIIIDKILKKRPYVLWSTPSIMDIIISRLKERGLKLKLPVAFFTSESMSDLQLKRYKEYLADKIVDIYGLAECPTMTAAYTDINSKRVFPNSVFIEIINKDKQKNIGTPIITNLINHTMPLIRYSTGDSCNLLEHIDFPIKIIGRISGRVDDLLKLNNGQEFAHHHAHEMFMDFHEVEMWRFVQKSKKLVLQLKVPSCENTEKIKSKATERWAKRFSPDLLTIQFVDEFKIDPTTGKFKNIVRHEN